MLWIEPRDDRFEQRWLEVSSARTRLRQCATGSRLRLPLWTLRSNGCQETGDAGQVLIWATYAGLLAVAGGVHVGLPARP